jgi:hypothetical protein
MPWTGGTRIVSPFEATASQVASEVAGRRVSVECHSEGSWRTLAAKLGVASAQSWAVTPFHWDAALDGAAPDDIAHFSPRACRFGDAFSRAPAELGTRTCSVAVGARGECPQWSAKLTAVHVLSHESVHLRGVYSEGVADCLAVQLDAYVAMGLGAGERFARSLAREFWHDYYLPRSDAYRSSACHEGGRLDLFPARRGWPTPTAYPRDPGAAIAAVGSTMRAVGAAP